MQPEFVLREMWTEFLSTMYMNFSPQKDNRVELVY